MNKEKRHLLNDAVIFIKNHFWCKVVLAILSFCIIVFIVNTIVSNNLKATFPERRKVFESYYDTIYEPKYNSLEEIVEMAISTDGINYSVLNNVNHSISLEKNGYVIDVWLDKDEAGEAYSFEIITKVSPEQKILSQESKKLSKEEYVQEHFQTLLVSSCISVIVICIFVPFIIFIISIVVIVRL